MSLFATALRKVENMFDKNTITYFYLYAEIKSQKAEKQLDTNTHI